ncbi:MAG: transcriptional activator NhaR [Myxococcaceae bacterium]
MEWLNYHHLYYFWTVARAGTIAKASEELRLAQPTISSQIKMLEDSLGQKLFERQGRRLVLTDVGRTVLRYADDIFRIGRELQHSVKGQPTGQKLRLEVGVADVIPKLVAERLLQPALGAVPDLHLRCREGPLPTLLGALAMHELDVVLSDSPITEPVRVKAFNHLLGETGISFFATGPLAALKKSFPASLSGASALLPSEGTSLRRGLDSWMETKGIRPNIVGEFDDTALMQAFGARGFGFFAAPTVIEDSVVSQSGATVIGRTDEIRERYYAVSVERRLRHPAVVAMAEAARSELFR